MSGTILYYDCFAGISGDMNLGALIDLGVPAEHLHGELEKLGVEGFALRFTADSKHGIHGTRADVDLDASRDESNQHHVHEHRTFRDIVSLIDESSLSDRVKETAVAIFRTVAQAEAKIHNQPVDEVHFHEIGALDSIVDIVGAAVCLAYLQPDRILSSAVELGGGFVKCDHGLLPVPAPATAEILRGARVKGGAVPFEATTPTGAAILATCVDSFSDRKDFVIRAVGYGVGRRDAEVPNVLRVMLAEEPDSDETAEDYMLECNIDDMSPEVYGHLSERLFSAGASDVFFTPIIMKKNRPATKLSVLSRADTEHVLVDILLEETTTFGLRRYAVEKQMLERRTREFETSLGKVRVKTGYRDGKRVKAKLEYEDCRKIAEETGLSLIGVFRRIQRELQI